MGAEDLRFWIAMLDWRLELKLGFAIRILHWGLGLECSLGTAIEDWRMRLGSGTADWELGYWGLGLPLLCYSSQSHEMN